MRRLIERFLATVRGIDHGAAPVPAVMPENVLPRSCCSPGASDISGASDNFLDVRPLLAEGRDPRDAILSMARQTPEGAQFTVEAPFNPVPLRQLLTEAGFASEVERLAADHWRIVFHHGATANASAGASEAVQPKLWSDAEGTHIDVRGLAPPRPMLEVLQLLESCASVTTIVVHHDREPVFLYPELNERGWTHILAQDRENDVIVVLKRAEAA